MPSFVMIRIMVSHQRSLISRFIKGIDESALVKDLSTPLMYCDTSDLVSLILPRITSKERTLWHNLGSMASPTDPHQGCGSCGKFVLISQIWSSVRSRVPLSTLFVVFQTCSLMLSYMFCVVTVDVNFRFSLIVQNLNKFLCHPILTEVTLTGFKRAILSREL